jgi:hypothetical protein
MRRASQWVLLLFLTTPGCADVTIPETDPLQEGVIVERNRGSLSSSPLSNIWVKTSTEEECGVVYRIDSRTDVWTLGSDGRAKAESFRALQVDSRVRAWASGLILDSCPSKTTARSVEVLP